MPLTSPEQSQKFLFEKSKQEGTARYNKQLGYLPISTSWGREMGSQLLPLFTEAITTWAEETSKRKAGYLIQHCQKLLEGDINAIAYIVMRNLFCAMGDERGLTAVAMEVGNAVEAELEGKKALEAMPTGVRKKVEELAATAKRRKRRIERYNYFFTNFGYAPEWCSKDRCRMGISLIHLFKQVSGLIEMVNVAHGSKRLKTFIVLTEESRKWITDYNTAAEILRPVRYPTVIKPLEWKDNDLFSGGYHELISYPLVKIRRKSDRDALSKVDITPIMNSVNAMQGVPWKINTRMLEVMKEYHIRGLCVNEVMPFSGVLELPTYNPLDDDIERKKEYKRQAFHIHASNFHNKTKAFVVSKMICLADTMKAHPAIYFPIQLDFRGRMYCFNEMLHYQGSDASRALLLFSEGKQLGQEGMKWLAIHGANKFGLDKKTYHERLLWVQQHYAQIQSVSQDPVSDDWWTYADDPWEFLAFCMEYATATPDTISHLPCSLDATNNGLQILSMLMRDEEGAKLTNVAAGDVPHDLYQAVADALVLHLKELEDPQAHIILRSGLVTRKLVKVPVMTIPYGVTRFGITRNIDDALAKALFAAPALQKILPMSERREMSKWLTKHLMVVMEPFLGESRKAMTWLKEAVAPIAETLTPIQWITPSGFPVNNDYKMYKEVEVKTAVGDRFDYRRLLKELPEMDVKAAIRTIAPNFVHSLDASVAHLVAKELGDQGLSFGIVHDCFFSHAASMDAVRKVVRHKYYDVFVKNQLENFSQQLSHHGEIKKIPDLGRFSIDELLGSEYFIS
jgi:DNA-directed RNA polymerase